MSCIGKPRKLCPSSRSAWRTTKRHTIWIWWTWNASRVLRIFSIARVGFPMKQSNRVTSSMPIVKGGQWMCGYVHTLQHELWIPWVTWGALMTKTEYKAYLSKIFHCGSPYCIISPSITPAFKITPIFWKGLFKCQMNVENSSISLWIIIRLVIW